MPKYTFSTSPYDKEVTIDCISTTKFADVEQEVRNALQILPEVEVFFVSVERKQTINKNKTFADYCIKSNEVIVSIKVIFNPKKKYVYPQADFSSPLECPPTELDET